MMQSTTIVMELSIKQRLAPAQRHRAKMTVSVHKWAGSIHAIARGPVS